MNKEELDKLIGDIEDDKFPLNHEWLQIALRCIKFSGLQDDYESLDRAYFKIESVIEIEEERMKKRDEAFEIAWKLKKEQE